MPTKSHSSPHQTPPPCTLGNRTQDTCLARLSAASAHSGYKEVRPSSRAAGRTNTTHPSVRSALAAILEGILDAILASTQAAGPQEAPDTLLVAGAASTSTDFLEEQLLEESKAQLVLATSKQRASKAAVSSSAAALLVDYCL